MLADQMLAGYEVACGGWAVVLSSKQHNDLGGDMGHQSTLALCLFNCADPCLGVCDRMVIVCKGMGVVDDGGARLHERISMPCHSGSSIMYPVEWVSYAPICDDMPVGDGMLPAMGAQGMAPTDGVE